MRYLSVCSGIEATSVAWQPLGWDASAVSEIDPFACAVLQHHYPDVPNYGDLTRFEEWPDACLCDSRDEQPGAEAERWWLAGRRDDVHAEHARPAPRRAPAGSADSSCSACGGTVVDVLVGGTPCQSFSVAGLRAGLDDPRGQLLWSFLDVARRYRSRWLVWENVPGVLSADDGRAFGALFGRLAELGYGVAYRVLDAQYFGLAQRRKRVFVVGCLGDWRRAAAVLFERASLSGHPAPRRDTGEIAPTVPARRTAGGGLGIDWDCDGGLVANCLDMSGHDYSRANMAQYDNLVTHSLRADGFDASEDGTGRGTPLVAFSVKDYGADAGDLAPTLRAGGYTKSHANGGVMPAVAFDARQSNVIQYGDQAGPLDTDGHSIAVAQQMAVRRLTPRECERLMGFPDEYTLVPYRGKPASDGPRYKALGNSVAVPVMRWIGERIQFVDEIP